MYINLNACGEGKKYWFPFELVCSSFIIIIIIIIIVIIIIIIIIIIISNWFQHLFWQMSKGLRV